MISHNVGTASILCCLDQSASMISAGLLHNVYGNGIFGLSDESIKSKRKFLSSRLGNEAEEYLFQFYKLNFNYKSNWRRSYLDNPDSLIGLENKLKDSLLIILADQYDHLLNMGILWRDEAHDRLEFTRKSKTNLVRMSEIVANPGFASKLENIIENALSFDRSFIEKNRENQVKYRIPKSYRKKLGIITKETKKNYLKKVQDYSKKSRNRLRELKKYIQ